MLPRQRSLVIAAAFSVNAAFGQIGTSTITGRITDPTGAVVPSVNVTVVQTSTNFTSTAVTNSEGLYRVLSLQPGLYRLTFEAQGFKRAVRDAVELRTGDTLAVDMVLQVGSVNESIEVSGAVALLETETSATGTVMSGNILYDLPLYQRYINSTMNLVPGMTTGGYAYGGSLGAYHLAGQRAGAIGIFEDGVNGNDQGAGTETTKPIQNSVAEVKVLTTVPPAEYGHSAGGVISAVKKSGTNDYHGLASFYGRTRRMQHRLFFDSLRTSQPTPTRPNGVPTFFMMPDANFSGPISIPKLYDGKNKTFFFFGYQRLHEKKVAQVDASVPSPEMRRGDFSNPALNRIFDPATTRRVGGSWLRDPFPGNIIPSSRIDPVARRVLDADPWNQPNRAGGFTGTGAAGNYLADEFARVFFDDYNLRLDHQFNSAFKIYYSWTDNRFSGFQRPWNIREDRPDFDHVAGNYSPSRNQLMSFGKTYIISPAVVNDARIGYTRRRSELQVTNFGKNWPQQLGIPNISQELMPAFGSGDRNNASSIYGLSGAAPNYNVNETISFRNDLSYIRGKHAFKMGYDLLRFRLNSAVIANPVRFDFSGSTTGLDPGGVALGGANAGSPFAGFLTGYVTSATTTSELTSWLPRSAIHSFYIQDDWKMTPTLTVNAGLRYSNESPFRTKYGLMSQFDPNGTDILTGRTGAIAHPTKGLNRRDSNNFNPRLGLAWHPLDKWVFRGGFGFYTVDVKFPAGREMYDEYQGIALQAPAPGDPTPIYQVSRATALPPARIINGVAPFVGTNFGGRNISYWDPNLRNPYVMNWNLSAQHEFTRDYLIEVSYQGSGGVGLIERWELNAIPITDANTALLRTGNNLAAAQNFRPYPHMGNITMRSNFGHSTFHSGTIKIEKRMSKGLYFNTFYTFSKAINSADTDNAGGGVLPVQNRNLEKARAGYDRNHRYIGTVNWELPFGTGKRFTSDNKVGRWLMSGWELSFIKTIESGNPLNFTFQNASTNNYYPGFSGVRRPNLVGQPVYNFGLWNNGGPDRFVEVNRPAVVNMNAFAEPAQFTVGNAGRNLITGPRLVWAQVSAQKNFRIGEKLNAQFRWDFQNCFKTYNFTGPGTVVDFRNPQIFGKLRDDPRTASLGGQPLMNITVALQF